MQQAQIDFLHLRQFSRPLYWAAFFLDGDWLTHQSNLSSGSEHYFDGEAVSGTVFACGFGISCAIALREST